jgi:hypothetical protein
MITPLELSYQTKDIAEDPDLGDLIAAESEYRRAGILNPLSGSRDAEKLTEMRPTVCQTSERLVSLGDHFLDFVGEVRKSPLNEVDVFSELGVPILALSQRAAKPNVLGQEGRDQRFIETVPHLFIEALDQFPVLI